MIAVKSRLFQASLFAALFMALGLGLTSCGGGGAQTGETVRPTATSRSIAMDLKFPAGYSYSRARGELSGYGAQTSRIPSYITRITLTISGNGIVPITVDVPLDTMAVTVFLSKGIYTFTLTVYTSIGVTFTGAATGDIGSATPPPISFDLDVNSPPTLDSLTVDNANIILAQSATLSAVASDLDGDALAYQWSASGGSISGSGNRATFSSGTPGTYTISVLVSDGHGGAATGSAQVRALNHIPTINSLAVDNANITIIEHATLSVSASDVDGDTLTYQWSASGGSIVGNGTTATFSSGTSGTYTISVLVSDGHGGAATQSVQVNVINRDPVVSGIDVYEPNAGWLYHNGGPVGSNCATIFQFECFATDPDGDPITYTWTVSANYWNGQSSLSATAILGGHANPFPQGAVLGGNVTSWNVWLDWLDPSLVFAFPSLSTLSVTCTATDGKGGSGSINATFSTNTC
jgi:hypothetical protein